VPRGLFPKEPPSRSWIAALRVRYSGSVDRSRAGQLALRVASTVPNCPGLRNRTRCPAHVHLQSAARACADIAAAAVDDDADDRPRRSRACMHAPLCVEATSCPPPTTGKPNVWFSVAQRASLPSTSDDSPKRTAPATGLGCPTCPRTSSMLERDAPLVVWMRLCTGAPERKRCARHRDVQVVP